MASSVFTALVICKRQSSTEKVSANTKTAPNTLACSTICSDTASATALTLMVAKPTRANGPTDLRMGKAFATFQMDNAMKEPGKMTASTGSGPCFTQMAKKCLRANLLTINAMGKALLGRAKVSKPTKELGTTIRSTDKALSSTSVVSKPTSATL